MINFWFLTILVRNLILKYKNELSDKHNPIVLEIELPELDIEDEEEKLLRGKRILNIDYNLKKIKLSNLKEFLVDINRKELEIEEMYIEMKKDKIIK